MWVRGLKLLLVVLVMLLNLVAPHVGAWIETYNFAWYLSNCRVAPHVGAWIETLIITYLLLLFVVAPHVGAWIETRFNGFRLRTRSSRTPCGCVD